MRALVIVLAATAFAAGCAQFREFGAAPGAREPQELPVVVAGATETERLLSYSNWLRGLSGTELGRERETLRRALSAGATDYDRLRYALALSVPGDPGVDPSRAIEALEPVAKRRESAHQAFALVLRGLFSEVARVSAEAQRANAELQRTGAERAELQRKLNSLKALEKSLSDREGAVK